MVKSKYKLSRKRKKGHRVGRGVTKLFVLLWFVKNQRELDVINRRREKNKLPKQFKAKAGEVGKILKGDFNVSRVTSDKVLKLLLDSNLLVKERYAYYTLPETIWYNNRYYFENIVGASDFKDLLLGDIKPEVENKFLEKFATKKEKSLHDVLVKFLGDVARDRPPRSPPDKDMGKGWDDIPKSMHNLVMKKKVYELGFDYYPVADSFFRSMCLSEEALDFEDYLRKNLKTPLRKCDKKIIRILISLVKTYNRHLPLRKRMRKYREMTDEEKKAEAEWLDRSIEKHEDELTDQYVEEYLDNLKWEDDYAKWTDYWATRKNSRLH